MCDETVLQPQEITFEFLIVGYDLLTPRQRTVLRLVAQERTSKEIAAQLGISSSTVDCHRKAAIKGLGVSGKTNFQKALRLLGNHLRSYV
jgi:DNA-binding CsgD family transcriptional regulator